VISTLPMRAPKPATNQIRDVSLPVGNSSTNHVKTTNMAGKAMPELYSLHSCTPLIVNVEVSTVPKKALSASQAMYFVAGRSGPKCANTE
jgi:hypothetical protein